MPIVTRLSVVLALGAAMLAAAPADATTLRTLHAFSGTADGRSPLAGLVLDKAGLLYGTASEGGSGGAGTVFTLDPATRKLTTLHAFTGIADGGYLYAGVVLDSAGLIYGATNNGGAQGYGTVFRLDPVSRKLTTLHAFSGAGDGGELWGTLVLDQTGVLYGTTALANGKSNGTVFRLDPVSRKLTTLHAFSGGADGGHPFAGVVLDKAGSLYGTTELGGAKGYGTVFKLDPATKQFTLLHAFLGGSDGAHPYAALVLDQAGELYGTTTEGGAHGLGTVFKLDPASRKVTILHAFADAGDAAYPYAALVFDKAGALYGTTEAGGTGGYGTVFKLDPVTRKLTTLHGFTSGADGGSPQCSLVLDSAGALYGTTGYGTTHDDGTVFQLTP